MSFSGTKRLNTKPNPGAMINPFHPLSKGLVGYWLFNEGTGSKSYDISGHNNHGILTNMSPNAQGSGWGGSKFGGGLEFCVVDDHVNCGNGNSLNVTASITIEVLAKFNSVGIWNEIVTKRDWGNVDSSYSFRISNTGKITFYYKAAGVSQVWIENNASLSVNTWYNLSVVFIPNSSITVRSNGINIIGSWVSGNGVPAIPITTDPVIFGGIYDGSVASGGYLNCTIDIARIYNRALLLNEVEQLYNDPFCNLIQTPMYQPYFPVDARGSALMAMMI